jgi:uncharacterized protein YodC (DUF2158 family)
MPVLEKGALVRLKSGGPVMTIEKCPGDASGHYRRTWRGREELRWTRYRCVWFVGNELKAEDFDEHLLTAV